MTAKILYAKAVDNHIFSVCEELSGFLYTKAGSEDGSVIEYKMFFNSTMLYAAPREDAIEYCVDRVREEADGEIK